MRFRFGYLAFLAVLAGGCVVDGASEYDLASTADDGAQEPVSDERALGTASQAITHTGEVYWTQGSPPQGLGPAGDRICFLTGIRGNFAGTSEVVKTYVSDGSWWLSGSSNQTGVGAWAACALTAPDNDSVEHFWPTQTTYPTNMGHPPGAFASSLESVAPSRRIPMPILSMRTYRVVNGSSGATRMELA